jgi:hypothetical protein
MIRQISLIFVLTINKKGENLMSGIHEKMYNWPKEYEEDKRIQKELSEHDIHVPQIEEIRAIEHEGETYYNAKDLTIAMKQYAYTTAYNSASIFAFIRMFTFELITALKGGPK